jgi:hypothetical protein
MNIHGVVLYKHLLDSRNTEMSKACSTYPAVECWQDRGMNITKREGKCQSKIFAKLT